MFDRLRSFLENRDCTHLNSEFDKELDEAELTINKLNELLEVAYGGLTLERGGRMRLEKIVSKPHEGESMLYRKCVILQDENAKLLDENQQLKIFNNVYGKSGFTMYAETRLKVEQEKYNGLFAKYQKLKSELHNLSNKND